MKNITVVDLRMLMDALEGKSYGDKIPEGQRNDAKSALSQLRALIKDPLSRVSLNFFSVSDGKLRFIEEAAREKQIVCKPKPRFDQLHPL